jgi:hypothetical protein
VDGLVSSPQGKARNENGRSLPVFGGILTGQTPKPTHEFSYNWFLKCGEEAAYALLFLGVVLSVPGNPRLFYPCIATPASTAGITPQAK